MVTPGLTWYLARMKLRILFHGNCFDGSASAGLFARFFREHVCKEAAEVAYTPMQHKGDAQAIDASLLDGDVNACVDFRYSQNPRLDWWFDHHASAFQLPGDEEHFRADKSGQKFYDPHAKSCTRFLAKMLAQNFGFDISGLADLLHWAEIIDGALFSSATMAVELREPALQLMTWVENNRDKRLAERFIEDLVKRPLADIAADPYVAGPLAPLLARHQQNIEAVRRLTKLESGVAVANVISEGIGTLNKFIVYYLHPDARYSVTLLATHERYKISVGSNPWPRVPRTHDISKLCEKYGGGGHPLFTQDRPCRGRESRRRSHRVPADAVEPVSSLTDPDLDGGPVRATGALARNLGDTTVELGRRNRPTEHGLSLLVMLGELAWRGPKLEHSDLALSAFADPERHHGSADASAHVHRTAVVVCLPRTVEAMHVFVPADPTKGDLV